MSPIAAYFLARNAFIFARRNLSGISKIIYICAQFLVRAPYNLLFRTGVGAHKKYLLGIYDGAFGSRKYFPMG
jgi:hypothetical protein